jgi:NAD(P)H-hydrate epimerase
MQIATAAQMRAIDRRAVDEFCLTSRVLMERAGEALMEAVREMLPGGGTLRIWCGKGNNGGDGLVLARLAREAGYGVECFVAALESELSADAKDVLATAKAFGVFPIFAKSVAYKTGFAPVRAPTLVVDALLGTGAKGELSPKVREAVEWINRSESLVLAVDVPSGVDSDTGSELGMSVRADRTVTFGLPKRCAYVGAGPERCGDLTVAPIGFPKSLLAEGTGATLLDPEWVNHRLPVRAKDSNKGRNGSILIVAGSRNLRGAAVLAAKGGLSIGAGLVTVASIAPVCDAVAANLPEAMYLELPEEDGSIAPEAAKILLDERSRFDVAIFGPGMTHGESVKRLLSDVFAAWDRPAVIDADALNCVGAGVDLPKSDCVLTPHPGEMARLLGVDVPTVQGDRFDALAKCLGKFGKTALLKGAWTLIGSPGSEVLVNPTGNSGLATGGTGDVLSGAIAGLLGQKLQPLDAAAVGAYCHGLAAELCAQESASIGYRASDVAQTLSRTRDTIRRQCSSSRF